jgi:hypothetical protein
LRPSFLNSGRDRSIIRIWTRRAVQQHLDSLLEARGVIAQRIDLAIELLQLARGDD